MVNNTVDEMIEILQAYKEGKAIECRSSWNQKGPWMRVGEPVFSFNQTQYRIKPKVKQIKRLYQFFCKIKSKNSYFATGEFFETFEECQEVFPYATVLRRLDHTMIEIEIEE
jgi:hypothetical protein